MKSRRGINSAIITNPLFAYPLSFVLVLLVYSLHWSSFYQEISAPLFFFVLITSFISLLIGFCTKRKSRFRPIAESGNNMKIVLCVFLSYVLEFIYCKSIPIISVTAGGIGNYRDFEGIPTFHVLLSGMTLFFGVYVFHQYQSNRKNKKLLVYAVAFFIPLIFVLNRGAIVLMLASDVFIYMMRKSYIRIYTVIVTLVSFFVFIFLFGIIGNARDSSSQEDKTYILRVGGATDEFIESWIPKEFYWGYLYIASPIGNLENAIKNSTPAPSLNNFGVQVVRETFPDFVSKRLFPLLPLESKDDNEKYFVTPVLNAPTVYFSSYLIMGWPGMIYMFLFTLFVVGGYAFIFNKNSPYFLTGWSYLTTTIILNVFNNMWVFNGLYLIGIAVFLSVWKRIKWPTLKSYFFATTKRI